MRNRIRKYYLKNDDIENLLKDTEQGINGVFEYLDFSDMAGAVAPAWKVDLQTIIMCDKKGNEKLLTDEDVDALIKLLNTVNRIRKDPEAPEETKALLLEMYFRHIVKYTLLTEEYHGEKLFERRAEIEKDNPLRDIFLNRYIQNKTGEYSVEIDHKRMKEKGIDPDKDWEAYYDNQTDEEKKKADEEWDAYFNDLCKKYGETQLIDNKDDSEIIKAWQEKLPEDIKKANAKFMAQIDKEIDELERLENEKQD